MTHNAIGFDCFQCGKCCNSGPALSIAEIFKFKDRFIVGLRYQSQYFSALAKLKKESLSIHGGPLLSLEEISEFKAHLALTQPKVSSIDGQSFVHIYPLVTGYSLDNKQGCEALGQDNLCTLHDDKPLMCQVVPFDGAAPESLQIHRMNLFKKYGCVSEINSDSEYKPIIFADRSIASSTYKAAYDEQVAQMEMDSKSFNVLVSLMEGGTPFAPSLESIVQGGKSGKWNEGSSNALLFTLGITGKANKDELCSFVDAQVLLINREISKATMRKNKNERQRTAILRSYLHDYEHFSRLMEDDGFPWPRTSLQNLD